MPFLFAAAYKSPQKWWGQNLLSLQLNNCIQSTPGADKHRQTSLHLLRQRQTKDNSDPHRTIVLFFTFIRFRSEKNWDFYPSNLTSTSHLTVQLCFFHFQRPLTLSRPQKIEHEVQSSASLWLQYNKKIFRQPQNKKKIFKQVRELASWKTHKTFDFRLWLRFLKSDRSFCINVTSLMNHNSVHILLFFFVCVCLPSAGRWILPEGLQNSSADFLRFSRLSSEPCAIL